MNYYSWSRSISKCSWCNKGLTFFFCFFILRYFIFYFLFIPPYYVEMIDWSESDCMIEIWQYDWKKNLRTQTINQNKKLSKIPFLPHVKVQTHIHLFPNHSNQSHTMKKISRRQLESVVISKTNNIKQRPGFYQILPYLENIILNKNIIKIKNG